MADLEPHFFSCSCASDEHLFKFTFDPDDGELYLSVYLHQYRTWWQRALVALRYTFGYHSKYGHWDTVSLKQKEIQRLHDLCANALRQT